MCLYPRFVPNPKYKPNKKNGFNPPVCEDWRVSSVPVGCGKCIECRKQKANEWRVRLMEEIRERKGYFITLTFSCEELEKLCKELDVEQCNAVAKLAVRRFLERWRKNYKKSVRHWLITELGHENTERIHLHGLIFPNVPLNNDILQNIWRYGNTYTGEYCNEKTINYIIKYVTKLDTEHKGYEPIILCSSGIGSRYTKTEAAKILHRYNKQNTKEFYRLNNGAKVNLPIYYRNKLFTEEQREELWLNKLDQNARFVRGIKCDKLDTEEGLMLFEQILKTAQEDNIKLGFGDNSKEWNRKEYNITLKMLNKK